MPREALIRKDPAAWRVRPWMPDLEAERARFGWGALRQELLGGGPPGNVNIARLALDRHAGTPRAQREALRFIGADGARHSLTYEALRRATNRFANALRTLGLVPGDRVFVLAGRCEPLYVSVLGALKAGCVVTPLFSAFGPEPIATRMRTRSSM
jgi:acetyl-CoA synthetase